MAWTTPKTFVANTALTATDLNLYLRDNMLLMPVSQATVANAGSYFVVDKPNSLTPRLRVEDAVTANESTSITEYDDLDTEGPSITLESGTKALIVLCAQASNAGTNTSCRMSFEISGDTEVEATDNYAWVGMGNSTSREYQFSTIIPVDVNAGTNTYTCKYRSGVDGSAASFAVRRIIGFALS